MADSRPHAARLSPPARGGERSRWLATSGVFLLLVAGWVLVAWHQEIRATDLRGLMWPWFSLVALGYWIAALALVAWSSARPVAAIGKPVALVPRVVGIALLAVLFVPFLVFETRYHQRMVWFDPIFSYVSDAIPILEGGLRAFWMGEGTPYAYRSVGAWENYFNFLPGLWLPFSVPWLAGTDVRLLTAAAMSTLAVLLAVEAGSRIARWQHASDWVAVLLPLLAIVMLYRFSMFRPFLAMNHVALFWLLLAVWALAWRGRMFLLAGILTGVLAATRPHMVLLGPLLLLYFVRQSTKRDAALFFGSAVASFAVLILPVMLADPAAKLYGLTGGYNATLLELIENEPDAARGFTLTAFLQAAGIPHLYLLFAAAAQIPVWALAWRHMHDEAAVLRFVALAILSFVFFAVVPFFYAFVPVLLLLTFSWSGVQAPSRLFLRFQLGGIALFFLLTLAFLTGWTYLRPPLHHPWPVRGGSNELFESRLALAGQAIVGWEDNTGETTAHLVDPNIFFALPVRDRHMRALEIDLFNTHTEAVQLHVTVNNVEVGSFTIESDADEVKRLELPERVLYQGSNRVHLLWPEFEVEIGQAGGVFLRRLQFVP